MFGLIMRDLMIHRKRLWLAGAYCLFWPFVLHALGQSTLVVVVVAVVYTLLITGLEYEDKDRVDMTMASLPIRRKSLVIARYLEIPLLTIIAMLSYLLVTGVFPWLRGSFPAGWTMPAAALLMVSLLGGINLPIIYRMGYAKARVFNVMIMLLGIIAPAYVLGYKVIKDPQWRTAIENTPMVMPLLMAAASAAILVVSCMISIRMYRKREF